MKPRSLFTRSTRRGSALLIVLGMVSFMIISAVAFSIFMRTSRLPSSYMRRNVSSRYLLKAALANAIERIDGKTFTNEGIFDDLYPGVGPRGGAGDLWCGRVFCPFGLMSPVADRNTGLEKFQTVSPLTLEGLAYLPPAVINEVRYYQRRTRTADWAQLSYEVGRYSFCAVDVSDCLDANKVKMLARSSAPGYRVGAAALFAPNGNWSEIDTEAISLYKTRVSKMENDRNSAQKGPFSSMADFNLFVKDELSPFCQFIGTSDGTEIYGRSDTVAGRALFITDTWFPQTNSVSSYTLSAGGRNQPFAEFADADTRWKFLEILNASTVGLGDSFRKALGGEGMICLYDYLDADNVPSSFALPTVETAPMVCALGVQPVGGLKTSVKKGEDVRKGKYKISELQRVEVTSTPYMLDLGATRLLVRGLAAYPFKRLEDKGGYAKTFQVDGLARIFLAPVNVNARLDSGSPVIPRAQADWADGIAKGVMTRKVTIQKQPTFDGDIRREKDAIKSFSGAVDLPDVATPLFWEVSKVTYTKDDNGNETPSEPEVYYSLDGVVKAEDALAAFNKEGVEENWWLTAKANKEVKTEMFASGTITEADMPSKAANADTDIAAGPYVPHIALWIKVANADGDYSGKVVDLVPASMEDDNVWGGVSGQSLPRTGNNRGTEEPPILRFSGTAAMPYGIKAVDSTSAASGDLSWEVLYASEPRYNFAPEVWYRAGDGATVKLEVLSDQAGAENWLASIRDAMDDPDIFMFTSDQEYLQSMGELQFLPRVHDMARGQSGSSGTPIAAPAWKSAWQFDGTAKDTLDFMPGMWRTYSAQDGDPVFNLGDRTLDIASSRGDFRVNPFTPDIRVFMTAIANTPYDFCVCSTNGELNVLGDWNPTSWSPAPDEGLKHAFGPDTDCAKWTDPQLGQIGAELHKQLLDGARNWTGGVRPRWEDIFDNLAWLNDQTGDDQTEFFGATLQDPLHAVDRKFLHSFWRECFQNRQQLFLVFVRAEPLTVGGGAMMADAQQGARGVALVWRDPEPPVNTTSTSVAPPHRTRVLFYHQFD